MPVMWTLDLTPVLCCCGLTLNWNLHHVSFTFTLDEMGTRIDDLEKNVSDLMTQAGMEEQAISKWLPL